MDPTLVKAGLRPPPPAAAALTRVGSIDSPRRQDFDGQERASRGPPTHSKKREPRTFPLDKKVPIQGRVRGAGDQPHRRSLVATLQGVPALRPDTWCPFANRTRRSLVRGAPSPREKS